MITNIKVPLEKNEYRTLAESAEKDIRSISGQARHLLRKALKDSEPVDEERSAQNEKKVSD